MIGSIYHIRRFKCLKATIGGEDADLYHACKASAITVLDEVMRASIQLQCIFSYTILANPEVEPHAHNIYQSKLVPSDSINSNKCEGSTSRP